MEIANHPEYIIRRFNTKFEHEGINVDEGTKESLACMFIAEIPNIIHEMAYGTEETALTYVNSL